MILPSSVLDALPGIAAGFSLRTGGVSDEPYGSLNLGRSTADDPAHVAENRRRFFGALGFDESDVAVAGQVHSARVQTVDAPGLVRETDGLVTNTPGLLLAISAADCAAVLLADAEARVVGACHAGWRGCVGGIVAETVRQMHALGGDPARMRAFVSPCISAAVFEVGAEVAARFDAAFVVPQNDGKALVDLKGQIRAQLLDAGLDDAHVEVSDGCTVSEPERFFSHRASGGTTGRMMGAIGLAA